MRAVIAVPPIQDFYITPHRLTALGPAALARLLRERGVETQVFNLPLLGTRGRTLPLPKELGHLSPFIVPGETGKASFFTSYRHYGPSFEECAGMVCESSPDVCFISCFAFCYATEALELARHVKALSPGTTTVMGGAGPSAYPEFFARRDCADLILAGEAEVSLAGLLDALDSGSAPTDVPGLYGKESGRVTAYGSRRSTTDGEMVFAPSEPRSHAGRTHVSVSLTRGCPKRCRFCSVRLSHGDAFRKLPAARLDEGLSEMPVPPGARLAVNFEDDNLLADPAYLFAAMDTFRSRWRDVSFLAENGMDYTGLSPETTGALIGLGMERLNLSIASTDESVLAAERRGLDLERYDSILAAAAARGVPRVTYFICGTGSDTPETAARNIAFLAARPTAIGISMFYAVPGLPGFEDRSAFDSLPPRLCAGSSAYPWHGSLTTAALVTAFRLCRYVNMVKRGEGTADESELARRNGTRKRLHMLVRRNGRTEVVPVENADRELEALFFELCPPERISRGNVE